MFLSVIVPVSGERYKNLRLTLTALECQTFKDFEVIVVNDGGGDDFYSICKSSSLDIRYVYTPKFEVLVDIPPRNKGARLARGKFYIFVDGDILLEKHSLQFYAQDFRKNPNRVVAGMYHWLPPMNITPFDVRFRFGKIIGRELPLLFCDGSHNVMDDPRSKEFMNTDEDEVHRDLNDALGCLGANLGVPAEIFWSVGGFPDWLKAGLCDDGGFGLAVYFWTKYGVSLDRRIVGVHIYHSRNRKWVIEESKKEVDKLDRVFHLGKYADGKDPERKKSVFEITDDRHKEWGLR